MRKNNYKQSEATSTTAITSSDNVVSSAVRRFFRRIEFLIFVKNSGIKG